MDRSIAKLAAALLLGTSLTACSTFDSATKPAAAPKEASKGNTSLKSMAADVDVQVHTAQAARASGDYAGATKILSQLMLVTPDNGLVVGEYGKTLVQQGRAKDALDFLKRAVQLSPGDWSLYSATGVAYDQTGDYANARLAYQQALAMQPHNAGVLNNYALSRMQAGDSAGARQLMAQASSAGGADPKIAQNVALLASYAPQTGSASASATATANTKPAPFTVHPLPQVPANAVVQAVPHDPKAGPVRQANGAPHKLTKDAKASVNAEPHKVAETAPAKKKVPAASNKTPALRMTADAANP
jgi:Flp pilus assembly protein TadD